MDTETFIHFIKKTALRNGKLVNEIKMCIGSTGTYWDREAVIRK